MKILFVSSYVDPSSGASILNRLAQKLLERGHEVRILTTQPGFDSQLVEAIRLPTAVDFIHKAINKLVPNYFGLNYLRILKQIRRYDPDVINIHWTHGYTIPIKIIPVLSKSFPVFWTIHDIWPITVNAFFEYTGGKSLLKQKVTWISALSKRIQMSPCALLDYKAALLGPVKLHTISPSKWLQEKVASSPVFRSSLNHHIPNGVDLDVFRCLDRARIREKYGIPEGHHKVILFLSANLADERKGFYYFSKAIEHLRSINPSLADSVTVLLVGGNAQGAEQFIKANFRSLGSTNDTSQLAEYYNLADVFVSTSLADNFPSTSLESLACGTPIVAFDVGGVAEIVVHGETGLLSDSQDIVSLARNISSILTDELQRSQMSLRCRKYAENRFSMEGFAGAYLEAFENALKARAGLSATAFGTP
jgi:glycosyltransferase involved in cell wall biosynthesis